MKKPNFKKHTGGKRNCGYIDDQLWVGSGYPIEGFTDLGRLSMECPTSVFYQNHNTITFLMMISKGNYNPLEMTFLENSAILEYTTAVSISSDIRNERKKT